MANKNNKGLGKGLDSLFGSYEAKETDVVRMISIDLIDNNPEQPRKSFNEEKLNELAESIQQHGIVQPLIVQKRDERYTIIAGERRFRAARIAGLREVPAIVREMDGREVMEVALIENIQRENLNPIEEAAAIRFLMKEHDLTQEEVAKRLSKSRPAIANSVRLLQLPDDVQDYLREGRIQPGHARVLAAIEDDMLLQKTAEKCAESGWSVRETEEQVKKAITLAELHKRPRRSRRLSNDLSAARSRMRERLGTRVDIQGDENKGKIIIEYYTDEGLQSIYEAIMGDDA
ncbi:MAG: ParB/RepB/Spo0J family partition protein [Clostridia bacterium]|nr:ParB/RepB/Spo0J family partition protein [Clostridia bacterium]MBQ3850191.1 ParB/RepB/Spo0J family partition protein [Clostridia bacterium]MBR5714208.1 ParB/RepB/Spo0J family partition protein [Clostridia bacterium]MBR5717451.1 ParB/RepB/Spo0J family partition protein [Clostridia bacterium]